MQFVRVSAAALAALLITTVGTMAQQRDGLSIGDCLTGEGSFASCMEDGPLVARLLREVRKDMADIRAATSKNNSESVWLGYNLRFSENRLIGSLSELFPSEKARLPASIATLVNELAVELVRSTKLRPNTTYEAYWTAETRAVIATLPGAAPASDELPIAIAPNDTHLIGQKFVEVYAVEESDIAPPRPISAEQSADIGRFQTATALCLSACQPEIISEIQNEIAAYRSELEGRNEQVSATLDHLDRALIDALLQLEAGGNA